MNTEYEITLTEMSDEEIISEIINGNTEFYRLIIKRYNQRLYRTALAFNIDDDDCDDVIQQTYIHAFEKLSQFKGKALFSTWLTKILINECLMLKRREKNKTIVKNNIVSVTSSSAIHQTPENDFMQKELKEIVEKAILELPEKYRQVFILREIDGVSVKEVSELLKITETNVKIRLHRAKSLLKKKISLYPDYREIFIIGNERCDNIADNVMEHLKPDEKY